MKNEDELRAAIREELRNERRDRETNEMVVAASLSFGQLVGKLLWPVALILLLIGLIESVGEVVSIPLDLIFDMQDEGYIFYNYFNYLCPMVGLSDEFWRSEHLVFGTYIVVTPLALFCLNRYAKQVLWVLFAMVGVIPAWLVLHTFLFRSYFDIFPFELERFSMPLVIAAIFQILAYFMWRGSKLGLRLRKWFYEKSTVFTYIFIAIMTLPFVVFSLAALIQHNCFFE